MAIIGDQLVTDIYAGTRYGIITVLVDPLGEKDLWVTKFNRITKFISYIINGSIILCNSRYNIILIFNT